AILRAALDRLHGVVPFTGGSIALVDGDDLVIRAATGRFEHEALGQRLARGASRSWHVVQTLEPVRIDDLSAAGTKITGAEASKAVHSWLAVPIEWRGAGIGLLEVDSTEVAAFTDDDQALVATIGRALAGPIDLAARYAAEQRASALRDAFTGVISHELRTPITTIYGMSQVLRQRSETMDPETRQQAIADIEEEADRLRRLAEDLLVLSRAEGGRLVLARDPLVIRHVVRQAVESEARRWPAHRFSADVPLDVPLVLGEELHVGQVLQNLLGNAAKYSKAGSAIEVKAIPDDDGVTITVLDEGEGLPAEANDQLFELFYRAPEAARRASGAGIGLFVCLQLVEAMGGRIWARQREGGGAEFGFWLPALGEYEED
ncbi:MAG TPA: ATP-binding protein, partial [Methylomirabilota bacterium]|nr:ATP-binding protein [Methylomirabilota bacterium]